MYAVFTYAQWTISLYVRVIIIRIDSARIRKGEIVLKREIIEITTRTEVVRERDLFREDRAIIKSITVREATRMKLREGRVVMKEKETLRL